MQPSRLLMLVPLLSGCLYSASGNCPSVPPPQRPAVQLYIGGGLGAVVRTDGGVEMWPQENRLWCSRVPLDTLEPLVERWQGRFLSQRSLFDAEAHRAIVYIGMPGGQDGELIWWGPGASRRSAHLEALDDILCTLEATLGTKFQRAVERRLPELVAARRAAGSDAPCAAASSAGGA